MAFVPNESGLTPPGSPGPTCGTERRGRIAQSLASAHLPSRALRVSRSMSP